MIKTELVRALAKDYPRLPAGYIDGVVEAFFDQIGQRLVDGGRVELRGFGVFSTRRREARKARNPRTGESIAVPGKRVPHFKASKEMLGRLKGK